VSEQQPIRPEGWPQMAKDQLIVAVVMARSRGGFSDQEIREIVEAVIAAFPKD
jgi:tellurite resistance protein